MPKKQRYAMDHVDKREKKFRKLYNLIGSDGVQVGIKFRGNNHVTFDIAKDDEIIKLFVVKRVARYGVDEILIQDENFVILDRFTPQDEGYSLWQDLLQESKNIKLIETGEMQRTGLYNGKEFLNSILPPLGKALNPNAVGRFSPAQTIHNNNLFADDTELGQLWKQIKKKSEATSTSTQLINEVSPTTVNPTTEDNSIVNITSEATSTSTQLINEVSSTTVDPAETTTEAPSTSTQLINEISPTTVDPTTELFDFTASKKEEEEHLESTTQKIRERNISMLTPPKKMDNDTESPVNGAVSIPFGPRQDISALLTPNSIENTTNLPLPGLTDNTASSGSMLWLAGAVSLGLMAAGFVGRALYNISHSVYNHVMKSGQHDLEKARKKAGFSEENHSVERQPFLPKLPVETEPSEESHHVEEELGTGIINPLKKSPRLNQHIDSSNTTEQLFAVVVREGQTPLDQAVQALTDAAAPLPDEQKIPTMRLLQTTTDFAKLKRHVTTVPGEEESPRGSLTELGSVTKKSVSNNDLHRGASF